MYELVYGHIHIMLEWTVYAIYTLHHDYFDTYIKHCRELKLDSMTSITKYSWINKINVFIGRDI